MTIKLHKRLLALLLALLCVAPSFAIASAGADGAEGFYCDKSSEMQADGSCRITLQAYQSGYVAPTDIVLVLDVSGSMEYSTPVPTSQIDPAKDYYIRYRHEVVIDGVHGYQEDMIRVHNEAAEGETPRWFGVLEEGQSATQVYPVGSGEATEYTFYTGAMEALRKAATDFTASIARNARENGAAHRIAVVEFSSPEAKGEAKCTHDNPFYANILSGDGTSAGALVSAASGEAQLDDIFAALTASGPTYSDDALAQAEAILSGSKDSHRVVVLFTDGGPGSYGWEHDRDNSALPTANAAITAAGRMKANGVRVYTIGVFNEENLQGEVGEKNRTYLRCISSDYPQAVDMQTPGESAASRYCSIGDLNMDLSGAFAEISAVIGEPIESAQVLDTISAYFYMTDAQKQALLDACPGVQITENADGTTTIRLDDRDFPPVSVLPDGTPASGSDAGIFTLSFDVTPRETFLGGKGIATNTGECGVFADGLCLASFETPSVDVPVNTEKLDALFSINDTTIYAGQQLKAEDLYDDLSAQMLLSDTTVTFRVTDGDGDLFTSGTPQQSETYTVTAEVKIGDETYTFAKSVSVRVEPDAPQTLTLTALPTKRTYFAGDTLDAAGLAAEVRYLSGKTQALTAADWTLSPTKLNTIGTQTVTVTAQGLTATFDVTVREDTPTLTLTALPTKRTYFAGDTLDEAGLAAEVRYLSGKTQTLTAADWTLSPTKLNTVGTQTVTVTAQGLTATFDVTVREDTPTLTLTALPTKRTYFAGDTLDAAGLAAEVRYLSGKTQTLTAADWTLSPTKLNTVGTQTVTVTAQGLTATFDVTVQAVQALRMKILSQPRNTTYTYRRSPDLSGLQVQIEYNNGSSKTLDYPSGLTVQIVSGQGSRRGSQTFRVSAEGVSADFTMQVRLVWWQWLILIFLLGWLWY